MARLWRATNQLLAAAAPRPLVRSGPKPFRDIPGPSGIHQVPVIGALLNFKPFTEFTPETLNRLFDSLADKYGPIFRVQLAQPTVVTSVAQDIETIVKHEGKYPVRPPMGLRQIYAKRTGQKMGLVDLNFEEWQRYRSPLNKRLVKVDSALHYLAIQNEVADDFVELLAQRNLSSEEVTDLMFRYASESIAVVCFNARLGFLDPTMGQDPKATAFLDASKTVFETLHDSISGASVAHGLYRNKTYRRYEQAKKTLKEVTMEHVAKAKQVLESRQREGTLSPDEPNLLLSLLSDQQLDHDSVMSAVETLYVGGNDSTAKNLQVLFFNLAKNPEKQENLRKEVTSILGKDQPLTAKALAKMPYLKACVKESFRMYPPSSFSIMRILPVDVELSGYRVPAGTAVIVYASRLCKHSFKDSEKYIPERWLRREDGSLEEDFPRLAFIPFGFGPRNCVGRRFAEQELYLGAAKVVQKLKVGIEPESYNTQFIYKIFIQPEKPIKFTFTKLGV